MKNCNPPSRCTSNKGKELKEEMEHTIKQEAEELLNRIFTEVLPQNGFTLRESQRELSLAMLEAMQKGQIALSEAEVGTGKTHAYILASIVYRLYRGTGKPTVISTSTIALQKAITQEYLPQISAMLQKSGILDRPLTWKLRKGKGHYVCDRRLRDYLASVESCGTIGMENAMELATLNKASWQDIDLDGSRLSQSIKSRINVRHSCRDCAQKDCRYQQMGREIAAGGYDFLIVNHNYVFADILTGGSLLPAHDAVIFDEAHKLPDTARDMYGDQLIQTEIPNLVRYTVSGRGALSNCGEQLLLENDRLFERLTQVIPQEKQENEKRYAAAFSPANKLRLRSMIDHLRELSCRAADAEHFGTKRKRRNIQRICSRLIEKLSHFLYSGERIIWLERGSEGWRLCGAPKELRQLLYRDLWQTDMAYILTSGTLSAPTAKEKGGFSHIRSVLGMELLPDTRITELRAPSPFDYRENALLYIPHMPYPRPVKPDKKRGRYINALADEIVRLVKASNGHALILFTSYLLLKEVYALSEARLRDFPLFCMERGQLDVIDRFRQSGKGVLFASDLCGEGLDIAGDTLSLLVVARLPFPTPDPITDYEKSLYPTLREYVEGSAVPEMLIKLKQYAGRLIRCEEDTGVIAILDGRAGHEGRYHEAVRESLFDTQFTDRPEQVRAFYAAHKSTSYFT